MASNGKDDKMILIILSFLFDRRRKWMLVYRDSNCILIYVLGYKHRIKRVYLYIEIIVMYDDNNIKLSRRLRRRMNARVNTY